MGWVKLHSPQDEAELAFLRSVLDLEAIPYFVHNDRFGTLEIGPRIDLYNVKTIMVPEEYADQARDLIHEFFRDASTRQGSSAQSSVFDRVRMVLEALFFGWFIPGRTGKRSE